MTRDNDKTLKFFSEYKEREERDPYGMTERIRAAPLKWTITLMIMALGFAGIIVVAFYLQGNSPSAIKAQSDLESEFHAITPLRNSTLKDYGAGHKFQTARVSAQYISLFSKDQIREHYDKELTMRGWRFIRESANGGIRYYRKGKYVADLDYQRDNTQFGYTYSLLLSWGLHDDL